MEQEIKSLREMNARLTSELAEAERRLARLQQAGTAAELVVPPSWESSGHGLGADDIERYSRQMLLHSFGHEVCALRRFAP